MHKKMSSFFVGDEGDKECSHKALAMNISLGKLEINHTVDSTIIGIAKHAEICTTIVWY